MARFRRRLYAISVIYRGWLAASVLHSGCHLLLWVGHWQLSKRVHRAHSERQVDRVAAFGVPEVRQADSSVRQHSGDQLAAAAGQMPRLQGADFGDLSGGGAADRAAFRRLLSGVRAHD